MSEQLVDILRTRLESGYEKHHVEVDGREVDEAIFLDCSQRTVDKIVDAIIYLDFEVSKLQPRGYKQEVRRLLAIRRALMELGQGVLNYRERLEEIAPELKHNGEFDEDSTHSSN